MPVAHRSVTRTDLRQAVVWQGLREAIARLEADGSGAAPTSAARLTVIDAGGGTGGFAVPLAEEGHDVTVVDPSPDSLASLGRRAAERGVAARIRGWQGDLSTLFDLVPRGQADLVLCHNVLEFVDRPDEALAAAVTALRPGGLLSVLAANRAAAVLARAVAGRFADATAVLEESGAAPSGPAPSGPAPSGPVSAGAAPTGPAVSHDGPARRFDVASLTALVSAAGADVVATHGVRVFADLVPGALVDTDAAAAAALLRLEIDASRRRPYLDIATQLHVLAVRRPRV